MSEPTNTKNIKDFDTLTTVSDDVNILGVGDINVGNGVKVPLATFLSNSISKTPDNILQLSSDNRLYVSGDTEGYVLKSGDTMNGALRINGMDGDNYAQFRILSYNNKYGMLFRADEDYLWIIPTNANNPYGQWADGKTQVRIEFSTGLLYANSGNGIFLKHTYVNGSSGYRIWTDGYCEQWGITSGKGTTVSLSKMYRDSNYIILFAPYNSVAGSGSNSDRIQTKDISQNSFYFGYTSGDKRPDYCSWYTKGYLAAGQY